MRIFICICTFLMGNLLFGQDPAQYIYGKITTKGEDEFEGFIRWGKEEIYWHDLFNSIKLNTNPKKNITSGKTKSKWIDFEWSFSSIWDDKYSNTTSHSFVCEFGDIKTLYPKSSSGTILEFKNGASLELGDGSNDIGATLRLEDFELGTMKFSWKQIERVDFYQAPSNAVPPYGLALYGIVETKRRKKIEGFIKWDLDERSGNDILDGESKHGDQEIEFKNISKIISQGDGCDVELRSGRSIYLDDSNDVDSGNRGIRVSQSGVGSLEIPWEEFRSVTFIKPPHTAPAYSDYRIPSGLSAEISTYDDEALDGIIIFDIDEMWETEFLDGNDADIEYQIPFKNITRIVPKNDDYSMIYLCDGTELLLGDSQDVSDRNDGIIIIIDSDQKDVLIDWDNIEEIIFK